MIIDVFELSKILPNLEMLPQKRPYKQFSSMLAWPFNVSTNINGTETEAEDRLHCPNFISLPAA